LSSQSPAVVHLLTAGADAGQIGTRSGLGEELAGNAFATLKSGTAYARSARPYPRRTIAGLTVPMPNRSGLHVWNVEGGFDQPIQAAILLRQATSTKRGRPADPAESCVPSLLLPLQRGIGFGPLFAPEVS